MCGHTRPTARNPALAAGRAIRIILNLTNCTHNQARPPRRRRGTDSTHRRASCMRLAVRSIVHAVGVASPLLFDRSVPYPWKPSVAACRRSCSHALRACSIAGWLVVVGRPGATRTGRCRRCVAGSGSPSPCMWCGWTDRATKSRHGRCGKATAGASHA